MTRIKRIDSDTVLARIFREAPDGLLTRGEATAIIASRTKTAKETMRAARNRVGMQLVRAYEKSSDPCAGGLARTTSKRFKINDIVRFALNNYPGLFDDLPYQGTLQSVALTDSIGLSAQPETEKYPASLTECHRLLRNAYRRIEKILADHEQAELDWKNKLLGNFSRKKQS